MLFSNLSGPENRGSEKEQFIPPDRLKGRGMASFGKEAWTGPFLTALLSFQYVEKKTMDFCTILLGPQIEE